LNPIDDEVDGGGADKDNEDGVDRMRVMRRAPSNWIIDLKQAFTVKHKTDSVKQRLNDCVQQLVQHFSDAVRALCEDNQESTSNASISFYRMFLSDAELQLVSKFSATAQCTTLFAKSLKQQQQQQSLPVEMVMQSVDNRVEHLLLNIMMQDIKCAVRGIHALDVWTKKTQSLVTQMKPPPNEYAKKIGNHWLALAQQLESHGAHEENTLHQHKLMDMMVDKDDGNNDDDEDEDGKTQQQQQQEDNGSATEETQTDTIDSEKWLNLVLNETVQALFMEFYKLNKLSLKGTKQMIEDLNYLCGAANAIYLDEPEFVYAILMILQCKLGNANTLRQRLLPTDADANENDNAEEENDDDDDTPKLRTSFQRKVATKLAMLRGLNIRFV